MNEITAKFDFAPVRMSVVKSRVDRIISLTNPDLAPHGTRSVYESGMMQALSLNIDADPVRKDFICSHVREKRKPGNNRYDVSYVHSTYSAFVGTVAEWFRFLDAIAIVCGGVDRYTFPECVPCMFPLLIDANIGNIVLEQDAGQLAEDMRAIETNDPELRARIEQFASGLALCDINRTKLVITFSSRPILD